MKTNEPILFKNLRNEVRKNQERPRRMLNLSQPDVLARFLSEGEGYVVPEEYQKFQEHIHQIDAFKKEVTSPKVLDDLVDLLKTGSTIELCRNYFGEINKQWNKWTFCCIGLDSAVDRVFESNQNIIRHMDNSISALDILIKNPADQEAKISLDRNINYIKSDDLENIYSYSADAIKGAEAFQESFAKQEESYKKIVDQLSKEATLQESEKQKIKKRIDELNSDISSYNATIAAIAIGLGVAATLFFVSVKVGGGFGFVVGLLLLPAVALLGKKLYDVIMGIKAAKKEIASYGDYESKYNGIIAKLGGLKSDVEKTQQESAKVKELISEVISPWTSLRKDLDVLVKYISDTENYETARSQFEEGKELWKQIAANAEYLRMPSDTKVVLEEIPLDTPIEKMLEIATTAKGVTMEEYLRRKTA